VKNLIEMYIKAKDCNKPVLMKKVFNNNAVLQMIVKSDNISFPSNVQGEENITNTLVKDFSNKFENVYTICIEDSIKIENNTLTCHWLVTMSDKANTEIKMGYGEYIWTFKEDKVSSLVIQIDEMNILEISRLDEIMEEVNSLSYPWCKKEEVNLKLEGLIKHKF